MYHDDYGMCCSEEAARRCAKEYKDFWKEEWRKELKRTILFLHLIGIAVALIIIFSL